jgi:hypothetical protein
MPLELDADVLLVDVTLDAAVVEVALLADVLDADVLDADVLVAVVATEDDVAEVSPLLDDGPDPALLAFVTPAPPAPPVPGPTGTTPVAHELAAAMPATSTNVSTQPQRKRRSLVIFMAPRSIEADVVDPEIERRCRVHDELDTQERREIQRYLGPPRLLCQAREGNRERGPLGR